MKTSRASSHAVCKSIARQGVTFVQSISEQIKRFQLGVDAKWNSAVSAPTDAGLILTDWLHFKVCSFDRLAAGRVRRALCAANRVAPNSTPLSCRKLFLWELKSA